MPLTITSFAAGFALWSGSAPLDGGAAAPTLDDLSFLTGAWESEDGDRFMREVWDAPRGDAMVGHFLVVEEGHAALYELFTIERQEDGALVLRLRHFGWGLEPWASEVAGPLSLPLKEVADGRAVFEDPERDFPRRLVYAVESETLRVRLEPGEGSERGAVELEFERAE